MQVTGTAFKKVFIALFIAFSGIGFSSFAIAEQGSIEVVDAWIPAPPPTAPAAAVYMVIKNSSGKDDTLTSVKSPVAGKAAMHLMNMDNGMMSMRHVEKISIPAHGSVKLHSGGLHIMMAKLKKPLTKGSKVQLTLSFEIAGKIELLAPVRK